jgi:glycosyltransferase involved in cell wall biosynthesis
MKVAQVCFLYHPSLGGVQTHVMKLSESLARKGIEVEVLTTDPTNKLAREETINNIPIRRFKSWAPMGDFHFSGELSSFLREHFFDYDVVHAHSYNDMPAYYAAQAKEPRETTNPFVFTPHYHGRGSSFFTNILHKVYKPFGRKIFSRADLVICVSKFERDLIEQNFSKAKGKILIIPNGMDFGEGSYSRVVDAQKEIPNDYILYVGRIESYKHVDRLVAALKYISRKDVSLVLVGNGPAKGKITKLANDLGIQNRITFYENLNEGQLDEKYRNASVLVNLSELEAYGLTVSEALARGTPCVVAKSSALAEWVDNSNCFGVDDPNNPLSVAGTIDGVIGRKVSGLKLPSWDDVAQKLIDAYNHKFVP